MLNGSEACMDADDFRRIALGLKGAEESSHMGSPDFRVGGRILRRSPLQIRATAI